MVETRAEETHHLDLGGQLSDAVNQTYVLASQNFALFVVHDDVLQDQLVRWHFSIRMLEVDMRILVAYERNKGVLCNFQIIWLREDVIERQLNLFARVDKCIAFLLRLYLENRILRVRYYL